MNSERTSCDDARLLAMLQNHDHGEEAQRVFDHVGTCTNCQKRLAVLAASDDEWNEAGEVLAKNANADSENIPRDAKVAWPAKQWSDRPIAWTESMAKKLLSPPSHPEMMGRIGRYEVERLIGAGGMGVVFKAFDTELNRPVAIKLLAPFLAGSGPARKRFAREARAAAAVVHEHVVPIHNVETEGESPFLVMHYVAGDSLQSRLDREGALEVCEILRIGMQAAAGLAAAHAQGLVHRDVKPSNILLEQGVERAFISDFGLARAKDDVSLTQTGYHPGTPKYMSPEQARGDAVDGRSDLFSFGSVLYAMCTGHAPFRAETSYGILRRIIDTEPRPIRELNPSIPEWLCAIISKLMSKQPDSRYATATEVAEVIGACLAHVQQPLSALLPRCVANLSQVLSVATSNNPIPQNNILGTGATMETSQQNDNENDIPTRASNCDSEIPKKRKRLLSWRWPLILGPIVGATFGFLYFGQLPPKYKAVALIQIVYPTNILTDSSVTSRNLNTRGMAELDVMRSMAVLTQAVEIGQLTEHRQLVGMSKEEIAYWLKRPHILEIKLEAEGLNSTTIKIGATTTNADFSADIAASVVSGYEKFKTGISRHTTDALNSLENIRNKYNKMRSDAKFELVKANPNLIFNGGRVHDPVAETVLSINEKIRSLDREKQNIEAILQQVEEGRAEGKSKLQLLAMVTSSLQKARSTANEEVSIENEADLPTLESKLNIACNALQESLQKIAFEKMEYLAAIKSIRGTMNETASTDSYQKNIARFESTSEISNQISENLKKLPPQFAERTVNRLETPTVGSFVGPYWFEYLGIGALLGLVVSSGLTVLINGSRKSAA